MAADKQWSDSEGLQFFCRHLIGLCITYKHAEDKADEAHRFAAFSGTLIMIEDRVHFLTSGHILRELEAVLQSDKVQLTSVALADTFGLNRISNLPIPFDLKSAPMFYIDDDDACATLAHEKCFKTLGVGIGPIRRIVLPEIRIRHDRFQPVKPFVFVIWKLPMFREGAVIKNNLRDRVLDLRRHRDECEFFVGFDGAGIHESNIACPLGSSGLAKPS